MSSPRETTPLRLVAAGQSHVGLVRERNEDRWFVNQTPPLFIVADGMGGQQGGQIASQGAIQTLPKLIIPKFEQLQDRSDKAIGEILQQSIIDVSRKLRSSSEHTGLKGMGTTVVLVLVYKGVAHLAHMGDSRIYLLRDKKLTLCTEDHSVIAALRRHGEIKPNDDISHHPARGRLSRYMGMEDEAYPDIQAFPLQVGDRLLLCSDGLSGMVRGNDIEKILLACTEPVDACRELLDAANKAGGKDNVTAIVIACFESQAHAAPTLQ